MSKKVVVAVGVAIAILVIIGLIIWLVIDLSVPPKFEITDCKLIVHDTYKAEIDLTNAEIVMSNEKLELTKRVVGTSSGSVRKGRFTMQGVDNEVYLSIMQFGQDYIFIKNGDKRFYINMQTSAETIDFYNKLLEAQK